jgi:hypothetical protein
MRRIFRWRKTDEGRDYIVLVMRGLDPRIHPLKELS